MIYVSSSCSRKTTIRAAVEELADEGYTAIELSGGTSCYPGILTDLLDLQQQFQLSFLLHNYFPPPDKEFVINLASLDDTLFERSVRQLQQSIAWSRKLGATRFGFHAGFFVDLAVANLGRQACKADLQNRKQSLDRFIDGLRRLQPMADGVRLYVENNVYSQTNYSVFGDNQPFMLLKYADFLELQQLIDINVLLDVGHLHVSAKSLNLDFTRELESFLAATDYVHLSSNDGRADENAGLDRHRGIGTMLDRNKLAGKTVTLEVYDGLASLAKSYDLLSQLCREPRGNP